VDEAWSQEFVIDIMEVVHAARWFLLFFICVNSKGIGRL
jgi:hypothetical protein